MKTTDIVIIILLCCILPVSASQVLSDGSDGAFNPQTSQTINLETAAPDGVFNFTTVHIPSDVTITFLSNSNNTPVFFAATGNILIEGTIDISSVDFGGRGPGGYLGGAAGSGNMAGNIGFGAGGGMGGPAPGGDQGNAGGGGGMATSGLVATNRTGPFPGAGGSVISRPKLNTGVAGGGGSGGGGERTRVCWSRFRRWGRRKRWRCPSIVYTTYFDNQRQTTR